MSNNNDIISSSRLMYSVQEVAEMLHVNQRTVRRLISRRLLRCSKAIRHIRIPKESVDEFVKDTTKEKGK